MMRSCAYLRPFVSRTWMLAAALALGNCSLSNSSVVLPSGGGPHSLSSELGTHDHLFVANLEPAPTVTMYPLRSNRLLLSIKASLETQNCLLDDSEGRLYVMDGNGSQIVVFSPDKHSVDYTISGAQGISEPAAMLLDSRERLYVSNYVGPSKGGSVAVFRPGTNRLVRNITKGIRNPIAIALSPLGRLFVGNWNAYGQSVSIYKPNSDTPSWTIRKGIHIPLALALDSSGNLYVLNNPRSGQSSVSVYSHDSYALVRTIRDGLFRSASLAFDSSGNLFVGNASDITVYAPGSSKVMRTIPTEKMGGKTAAMTFDNSGYLYAAYQGADLGGVRVYPPGSSTPVVIIRHHQGVGQPVALAIGP